MDSTTPVSVKPSGQLVSRDGADPHSIRTLLVGGDRRSIARSNDALALLRTDKGRVAELAQLIYDDDWLVVLRTIDLMEKLAHEHPDWIQRYRKLFIGPLAEHKSWEIRLQIARALPLLRWTRKERERVLIILRRYLNDPQKFVKAWALDSLARFAERDASLMSTVNRFLLGFEESDSPALRSRAKQIRFRLRALETGAAH